MSFLYLSWIVMRACNNDPGFDPTIKTMSITLRNCLAAFVIYPLLFLFIQPSLTNVDLEQSL